MMVNFSTHCVSLSFTPSPRRQFAEEKNLRFYDLTKFDQLHAKAIKISGCGFSIDLYKKLVWVYRKVINNRITTHHFRGFVENKDLFHQMTCSIETCEQREFAIFDPNRLAHIDMVFVCRLMHQIAFHSLFINHFLHIVTFNKNWCRHIFFI